MNDRLFFSLPFFFVACLGGVVMFASPANAQEYLEPDFSHPLFSRMDLALPPTEHSSLVVALVELAKQEELDPAIKSGALAFAFTLAPENWDVIEANFFLRNGIKFSGFSRPRAKDEVLSELTRLMPKIEAADGTLSTKASVLMRQLVDSTGFPSVAPDQDPAMDGEQPGEAMAPENFPREFATVGGVFLDETRVNASLSAIEKRWDVLASSMKPMKVSASVREFGSIGSSITVVKGQQPPELASAMHEMVKMFSLRNVAIPSGNRIDLSFGEGYSQIDGPSSVLACALLVDALVNDVALDPQFAPLGDLNADGSIQPIYFIRDRILATQPAEGDSGINLVAIPEKNASRLGDLLLTEGVDPIFQTQIFTVKTFEEAKALAVSPNGRDADLQESIELFAEVQDVLRGSNPEALLSNQQVRERLTRVLELAPNHVSAKLLLLRGSNRHPRKLTLAGSLDQMLHAYVFLDRGRSPKYETLQEAITTLGKARSAFDPRSLEWLDSINQYNSTKRRESLNLSSAQRSELRGQIAQALNRVELEYQKLMSDPDAREALMR